MALPPVLLVALAIHRGAVSQAVGRWWSWRPSLDSAGWILATFAGLTMAGGLISSAPAAIGIPVAGGAGLLNARAYYGIVQDLARAPRRHRSRSRVKLVPIAVAAIFALVLVGTYVGFLPARAGARVDGLSRPIPVSAVGHPVLIAAGFGSRWDSRPILTLAHGFVAWRFSYRGLDRSGRPLP